MAIPPAAGKSAVFIGKQGLFLVIASRRNLGLRTGGRSRNKRETTGGKLKVDSVQMSFKQVDDPLAEASLHRINPGTATLAGNFHKQPQLSQATWFSPVSISVPDNCGPSSADSTTRKHTSTSSRAATSSSAMDDEKHVLSFSVVGGDHRLNNYRSVTTLHRAEESTVVVESYEVDVPQGNTKEETCVFVDTIVRCNLQSLAQIAEDLAKTKSKLTTHHRD
ncbi:hypothetical protein HAX54_012385 [Datura stramonium]|uniref:Uncharacterized protein n=1 Tax=Datura stramonium TaxID=4076 RepID=A0ABS8Y2N0_DATST|nr:hypothetical protein [Datura stramonium]